MRILLLTLTTCLLALPVQAKYSGGSGTASDPYQIATPADLIALGETPGDYDKHFVLTADIDLDPKLPGRKVFNKAVIAAPASLDKWGDFQGTAFTGVFDGKGHVIGHLMTKGDSYLGLFGQLGYGAAVRKLGVVAVNITGSGNLVGGLAAENVGAVTQCYSTGAVATNTGCCGGLVGLNWGVLIQCYSTAAVSGYGDVGGLVAITGGKVIQCYSTGAVSDTSSGLVGSGYEGEAASPPIVTASFWDTQSSGQATSAGGTGLTTAQMQTASTFLDAGWDFVGAIDDGNSQIWQMPEGGGYPVLAVFNGYAPPRLQGAGTPEDPYTVSDALELGAMVYYSPYAHYRLTASIDLSGIHWRTAVIPWFAGTFDGSNHTISNLTINGESDLGLFAILGSGAGVRDLGVVDVNVVGSGARVGALAGYASPTSWGDDDMTLTHCYTTGKVSSTGGSVGGLVGQSGDYHAGGGSVTQCYSTCAVIGTGDSVGGLVGFIIGGVTQCYSTGAVSGKDYVGGLLGYGDSSCCYSTGPVSGKDYVGGLLGYGDSYCCYSTGPVSGSGKKVGGLVGDYSGGANQCFWDVQTSGQTVSDGGTGKTTAEMQTGATFLAWSICEGEGVWTIDEGNDYPRLSWEKKPGHLLAAKLSDFLTGEGTEASPYLIYTPEQLHLVGLFACERDKHFKLMADIDLAAFDGKNGRPAFNIIAPAYAFEGVFDGNRHTISHLTIKGGDRLGLFGQLESGAEVKNLGVVDVNVTGSGSGVGGLVGQNSGIVVNCFSTGAVSGKDSVGGLVGSNVSSLTQCYSAGAVTGSVDVGGLVGSNDGTVTQSYSTGAVSGTRYVGGLVGGTWHGTVTQCYSIGAVTGSVDVGGLVGHIYSQGFASGSFWDTQTSGQTTSAGGTGKTTADMQTASTFLAARWDFVGETANGTKDIWWILEGKDYPRLSWEAAGK